MTSRSCWRGCELSETGLRFQDWTVYLMDVERQTKADQRQIEDAQSPQIACYHHPRVQECLIISVWQIGRWPSKTVKKIFIFSLFKSDSIFFSEVSINPESSRICFPSTLSCTWLISIQFNLTWGGFQPKTTPGQLLWGALLCGGIQCFDPSLAHPERFTQGITTTPGVVTAPCFGEIPRALKLGERG